MRPQSLNSTVISTATGLVIQAVGQAEGCRRPLVLPHLIAVEIAELNGFHAAEQVLDDGLVALHGVDRGLVAALQYIVDERVGNALQRAALLAAVFDQRPGSVQPAGGLLPLLAQATRAAAARALKTIGCRDPS